MSKQFDSAWLDMHNAKVAEKALPKSWGRLPGDLPELEQRIHRDIEIELKRRRWYYVHSRTDKRTTTQLGVTDFIIAIPQTKFMPAKTLWLECKRKGGKLTQEQNTARHILVASGHWHAVVYSITEFMGLLKGHE